MELWLHMGTNFGEVGRMGLRRVADFGNGRDTSKLPTLAQILAKPRRMTVEYVQENVLDFFIRGI